MAGSFKGAIILIPWNLSSRHGNSGGGEEVYILYCTGRRVGHSCLRPLGFFSLHLLLIVCDWRRGAACFPSILVTWDGTCQRWQSRDLAAEEKRFSLHFSLPEEISFQYVYQQFAVFLRADLKSLTFMVRNEPRKRIRWGGNIVKGNVLSATNVIVEWNGTQNQRLIRN